MVTDLHPRELAFKVQTFWQVYKDRPACNDRADLLTEPVQNFLKVWPNGDVNSAHFIAYLVTNLPMDSGDVGYALRSEIQAEAKFRSLARA